MLKMANKILLDVELPNFVPKQMKKKSSKKKTNKNFVEDAIDTFRK